MTKHIPYLDGWRGLAIACLFVGHFFPIPGINFGRVGVVLFFVLSGLLMARVLFIQQIDFATFYRRRVARVFPSVMVYLAVISGVFLVTGHAIAWTELFSALTFTNNYVVTQSWAMPFGHIWSLSVEEQSYVILSLAAYWCRMKAGGGLAAIAFILCLILLAIAIYSWLPGAQLPSFQLRTEVASFGIFMSVFLTVAMHEKAIDLTRWWIAPAALIVGIAAHWWALPAALRMIAGAGALAVAINAMPSAPAWLLSAFSLPWLRQLGRYSFSLYLWQQPFYQLSRHSGMSPVLGLLFSLAAGWAAFHLIENPARTFLNARWGAKRGGAVASESDQVYR